MPLSTEFKLVSEEYPRIGAALKLMWGTRECYTYLNNLMFDTRENTRQGFSKEVGSAIGKLQTKHNEDFPEFVRDANDVWTSNYMK